MGQQGLIGLRIPQCKIPLVSPVDQVRRLPAVVRHPFIRAALRAIKMRQRFQPVFLSDGRKVLGQALIAANKIKRRLLHPVQFEEGMVLRHEMPFREGVRHPAYPLHELGEAPHPLPMQVAKQVMHIILIMNMFVHIAGIQPGEGVTHEGELEIIGRIGQGVQGLILPCYVRLSGYYRPVYGRWLIGKLPLMEAGLDGAAGILGQDDVDEFAVGVEQTLGIPIKISPHQRAVYSAKAIKYGGRQVRLQRPMQGA